MDINKVNLQNIRKLESARKSSSSKNLDKAKGVEKSDSVEISDNIKSYISKINRESAVRRRRQTARVRAGPQRSEAHSTRGTGSRHPDILLVCAASCTNNSCETPGCKC